MTDIVERLRGENWWLHVSGDEAADEIERLRSKLRSIAISSGSGSRTLDDFIRDIGWINDCARSALAAASARPLENKTENKTDPEVSNHASPECQT
jgi:hypothetical protein